MAPAEQGDRSTAQSKSKAVERMLASWEVEPSAAAELRRMHASALNTRAARALLAVVDDAALEVEISALLPALAESTWTGPEVAYAYYVELADDRRPPRAAALAALSALIECTNREPPPRRVGRTGGSPAWVRYAMEVFARDRQGEGRTGSWAPYAGDAASTDTYRAARELLAAGWREMAAIHDLFVREIVWYENDGVASRAATLTQTFGALYLNRHVETLEMLEHLVHETTHLEVMARTAFDRLIENRDDHARSPFREQPRPLGRVLHAGMVAARVARAYDRCIDLVPASRHDEVRQRRELVLRDLHVAIDSLREHARWTARGAQLFESLERDESLAVPA